jgi:hypothetical protein
MNSQNKEKLMQRSASWIALVWGLGAVLSGCARPCDTTSQCGGDEVCAAAICQKLSCEAAVLLADPASGACVPLSPCFLTEAQKGWSTCAQDPCQGLSESSCLEDARCQPAYANPKLELRASGREPIAIDVACAGGAVPPQPGDPRDPNGQVTAPGVNNGDAPKHRRPGQTGCFPETSARAYAGCRVVPQVPKVAACESLSREACATRRDCTTGGGDFVLEERPTAPIGPDGQGGQGTRSAPVCFSRVQLSGSCEGAGAESCLLNPRCQPIGSRCYCPPGASCACAESAAAFIGCESNDRLRRCQSAADCRSGERCDRDEACIAPRTYESPLSTQDPVPGTGSCLGACVPTGCAGYGERFCHEHPECDAGSYGTVCRPKPYCSGGGKGETDPPAPGPVPGPDPTSPAAPGVGQNCGCDTEFTGCAPQPLHDGLRPERSLLVRDPEIVSDPAFRIDTVISRLAPAGRADEFTRAFLQQLGAAKVLPNGAAAGARRGYGLFYDRLSQQGKLSAAGLAGMMHTTALVNRLDLAAAGDCGEARLTYALSDAYVNGNQRMTMIVELRVPDDGNGCRTVAQRWAELSLIDDSAERLGRLRAIFGELLRPEGLGQVRTNEFLNGLGREPWELREWRLGVSGLLDLAPVKQTVAPAFAKQPGLIDWARSNAAALQAGTAVVPAQYLAAASTEDGGRLLLPGSDKDATLRVAEKALNELSCAGCHLTETQSPFTHIGERLGRRVGGRYEPAGRAVIDEFMRKELISRAANLRAILSAPPKMLLAAPWRAALRTRVH